ncbi:MAG: peptide deformylase, partial [Clostridiales bacterium]
THVKVTYQDRNGQCQNCEAEGFYARVLQHEIDHLYGRLFVDVMTEEIKDEDE